MKLIKLMMLFVLSIFCITTGAHAKVFQTGMASYYGKAHHGRKTASGERFNMYGLTAAHRTLPFGTKLKVTSLDTGETIVVTVTDRGPFKRGRILDLSQGAAKRLGMLKQGVTKITIEKIRNGKHNHDDSEDVDDSFGELARNF